MAFSAYPPEPLPELLDVARRELLDVIERAVGVASAINSVESRNSTHSQVNAARPNHKYTPLWIGASDIVPNLFDRLREQRDNACRSTDEFLTALQVAG